MASAARRIAAREALIAGIAGLAFVQAIATVVTIIPVYLAWRSAPRAFALLGYALVIAALAFGLFRWRRPFFPMVLALLVFLTNADYVRRGAYVGLIPGALYFTAYVIGVAVTWRTHGATTSASV